MTWRVHGMAATGAPSLHASSQHPAPSALPASQEGPLACARPQASAHGMAAAGALALRVGSQHSTQRWRHERPPPCACIAAAGALALRVGGQHSTQRW